MRYWIATLLFWSTAFSHGEQWYLDRVGSHLIVGDMDGALKDGAQGLALFPTSNDLQSMLIRVYSARGEASKALDLWKRRHLGNPFDIQNDFSLVESLAWGVLKGGGEGSQMHRLMALIGAYLTQDHRAVQILIENLQSSNAMIRAQTARLCAGYRDQKLQRELFNRLLREKNWFVRQELIRSIGSLKVLRAKPKLKEIIGLETTTSEERALSIQALVEMTETLEEDELATLCNSKRAGLRALACSLALHFGDESSCQFLYQLLKDPAPDVRISALNALHLLDVHYDEKGREEIALLTKDLHPGVALTAAWVTYSFEPSVALEAFEHWLHSDDQSATRFASSILTHCGQDVQPTIAREMQRQTDPIVKANLARGALRLGSTDPEMQQAIDSLVANDSVQLMFDRSYNSIIEVLESNQVRHIPHVSNYPQVVDSMTRLELLNILTLSGYSEASDKVATFLKTKMPMIIASAAQLLIEEGEMEVIDEVRKLIDHSDSRVAIHAALVLAFVGRETEMAERLTKAYESADWEMRITILEALGHLGSREVVPFLLMRMNEPFRLVRIIAASSLVQCLYH